MLDSAADASQGYPPYNIERSDETHYRITLAVAGFGEKDLNVEVRDGVLTVSGKREDAAQTDLPASGHCGPRLRAPLPARRACRGPRRQARERPAPCRSGARRARREEAAPHRDQRPGTEDHRGSGESRLIKHRSPSPRGRGRGAKRRGGGVLANNPSLECFRKLKAFAPSRKGREKITRILDRIPLDWRRSKRVRHVCCWPNSVCARSRRTLFSSDDHCGEKAASQCHRNFRGQSVVRLVGNRVDLRADVGIDRAAIIFSTEIRVN